MGGHSFPRMVLIICMAGFNPYTERVLRTDYNAENSIVPAMAANGIHTHLDWRRQSDLPGVNDVRDEKYEKYYREESRLFIEKYPADGVKLSLLKFETLMSPDYKSKEAESARLHELIVVFKYFILLIIPAWVGLLVYSRRRTHQPLNWMVIWTVVLYFIPFIMINASPRFRITIEGVIILDMARMLYDVWILQDRRRSSL